jgi:hypothetical protein
MERERGPTRAAARTDSSGTGGTSRARGAPALADVRHPDTGMGMAPHIAKGGTSVGFRNSVTCTGTGMPEGSGMADTLKVDAA